MNTKYIFMAALLACPLFLKSEEFQLQDQGYVEKKSLLTDDMCKMLDMQMERNLTCQRKLRQLMRPLVEEFSLQNYTTIEKLKEGNQVSLTEEEITMVDTTLVAEFCAKNLEAITSLAMQAYEITPQSIEAESFAYVFKKSFAINYKEDLINNLEIQRKVTIEMRKKNA